MMSNDYYRSYDQENNNTDDGVLLRNINRIMDVYNLNIHNIDIILMRGNRLYTPYFRVDMRYTPPLGTGSPFMATAIGEGKELQQQIISMFRDLKKHVDNVVAPLVPWPGIEKNDPKQQTTIQYGNIPNIPLPPNVVNDINDALEQEIIDEFDPPPPTIPPTPPQKLKQISKPIFDDGTKPRRIYLD